MTIKFDHKVIIPKVEIITPEFCNQCGGCINAILFYEPCDCEEHDPWEYHQGTDGDL